MLPVDYWKRIMSVDIIGLLQSIYFRGFIGSGKYYICRIFLLVKKWLKQRFSKF